MAKPTGVKIPEELGKVLSRMTDAQIQKAMKSASQTAAPGFTRALIEKAQAEAGSGPFARGWIARTGEEGAGLQINNDAPSARFIELPTKAHTIKARPGTHTVTRKSKSGKTFTVQMPNMLAWIPGRGAFSAFNAAGAKARANWKYAKEVHHPGTPGKHVFEKTVRQEAPKLWDTILEACKAVLKGK